MHHNTQLVFFFFEIGFILRVEEWGPEAGKGKGKGKPRKVGEQVQGYCREEE
jgi:hypothetical protein